MRSRPTLEVEPGMLKELRRSIDVAYYTLRQVTLDHPANMGGKPIIYSEEKKFKPGKAITPGARGFIDGFLGDGHIQIGKHLYGHNFYPNVRNIFISHADDGDVSRWWLEDTGAGQTPIRANIDKAGTAYRQMEATEIPEFVNVLEEFAVKLPLVYVEFIEAGSG